MRKNGFTLAELLGVMVLLSLISIITVPAVTQSLNSYKTKLCNSQINQIEVAAESWAKDNILLLPEDDGDTYSVDLKTLSDYGYIESKINNPVTNENFDLESAYVNITKKGKRYIYKMDDDTINTCYSNGVKKPSGKKYPRYVYSKANGGTHVGYPIDANKDMGDKYVWTNMNVGIPFNSQAECNQSGGSNEQCVLQNFKTPDLDYKTSPDTSWNYYLKYKLNSAGIIEDIEACGKYNNQEFCLKRSQDGSKYEQNKTLLLNIFGSENCYVNDENVPCHGSSIFANARADDGSVMVSVTSYECDVLGIGVAACYNYSA